MSEGAERELSASSKRRAEFAGRGEVPKSRDLLSAVVLLVGVQVMVHHGPKMGNIIIGSMRAMLGQLHRGLDRGLMLEFGTHFCQATLPVVGIAAASAVVGGVLQHRGVPPWHLPGFDLNKINPIGKLGGLFGPKKMASTVGISLLKMLSLAVVFYVTLKAPLLTLVTRVPASLAVGLHATGSLLREITTRGLMVMLFFGLVDYGLSWWKLEKRMRMTLQELKDENKEDNGDPRLKSRRRRMAQDMIKARSIKNVPKADVVLVNPTHFAVAISYREGKMSAPTVIAKGADSMAEKIRALARSHGVPIVSQPPLTRLLYAEVDVGHPIPAATFSAVAVILAHVYRLRRRAS